MKMPESKTVLWVVASVTILVFLTIAAISMRYKVMCQSTETETPLVIVYDTWTGEISVTSEENHNEHFIGKLTTFYARTRH